MLRRAHFDYDGIQLSHQSTLCFFAVSLICYVTLQFVLLPQVTLPSIRWLQDVPFRYVSLHYCSLYHGKQ